MVTYGPKEAAQDTDTSSSKAAAAHHDAREGAREEGEIPDREGKGGNEKPFSQRENDPGIEKGKAENERLGLTPKAK